MFFDLSCQSNSILLIFFDSIRVDYYLEYLMIILMIILHYLWTIYDKLSSEGFVAILGDFYGDLGNSLGDKDIKEPNQHGLKLFEFANHFNLCPVNLSETCQGPIESYVSHCGRFRSTIDYVFIPNCLSNLNLLVLLFL